MRNSKPSLIFFGKIQGNAPSVLSTEFFFFCVEIVILRFPFFLFNFPFLFMDYCRISIDFSFSVPLIGFHGGNKKKIAIIMKRKRWKQKTKETRSSWRHQRVYHLRSSAVIPGPTPTFFCFVFFVLFIHSFVHRKKKNEKEIFWLLPLLLLLSLLSKRKKRRRY